MVEHGDAALTELAAEWRAWLKERPQYREAASAWVTQLPDLADAVRGGSNSGFNRDGSDAQAEADYFAMLNDRALLDDEVAKLPHTAAQELRDWLDTGPDRLFRDVTEDQPTLAAALAWLDEDDDGWFWRRAPKPGWLRDALERKAAEVTAYQQAVRRVEARLSDPSRLSRHVAVTLDSGTEFILCDSVRDDELIRRTEVEIGEDGGVRLVAQLIQVLDDGTELVLAAEPSTSPKPETVKAAIVRYGDPLDR